MKARDSKRLWHVTKVFWMIFLTAYKKERIDRFCPWYVVEVQLLSFGLNWLAVLSVDSFLGIRILLFFSQRCSKMGAQGGPEPPRNLADQSTLFKTGGQIIPLTLLPAPLDSKSYLHLCFPNGIVRISSGIRFDSPNYFLSISRMLSIIYLSYYSF